MAETLGLSPALLNALGGGRDTYAQQAALIQQPTKDEVLGTGLMQAAGQVQGTGLGTGLLQGLATGYGLAKKSKAAEKRDNQTAFLLAQLQHAQSVKDSADQWQTYMAQRMAAEQEKQVQQGALDTAYAALRQGSGRQLIEIVNGNEKLMPVVSSLKPEGAVALKDAVWRNGNVVPIWATENGDEVFGQPIKQASLFSPDAINAATAADLKGQQAEAELRKTNADAQLAEWKAANPMAGKSGMTMKTVIDADGNEVQVPVATAQAKPMPASAVKLQNDTMEELAIANNIQADLKAVDNLVASGSLELGPLKNWVSWGQNLAGMSSENSRNYQSFQSTLEKLRNDSLRLNKGVQTEGDAVRAWNELLANINDEGVVRQRLGEIQNINARAADLKKLQIETLRGNYGQPAMDYSRLQGQAAIGQPKEILQTPQAAQIKAAYQRGEMTKEQAKAALQQLGGQ